VTDFVYMGYTGSLAGLRKTIWDSLSMIVYGPGALLIPSQQRQRTEGSDDVFSTVVRRMFN